jgi:hypothetical protein
MFAALEKKADTSNWNLQSFTVQLVGFRRFLSAYNTVTFLTYANFLFWKRAPQTHDGIASDFSAHRVCNLTKV